MKLRLRHLLLALFSLTIVVPVAWLLMTSLKSGAEIFANPWAAPQQLRFENFSNAWFGAGLGRNFVNSLIVSIGTLLLLLPIGSMAAYVLARYPFRGSKLLSAIFMGGMMFPNFLVVVPLFFLLKNVGLLDSLFGLTLVYVAYSLPFTIFVLTGFFSTLPNELAEAADVDGATDLQIFTRVMLPLARPGILVVGIFNAIGLWNEYGLALVLLSRDVNRTLPLGIADIAMARQYDADWGALFAALVVAMLPVTILYAIFREKIHQAMLAGALKG